MKKYLLIIICLTMALMSYTAKAAVLPACTGSATLNADQTECATKADTQQLTISKVMLCSAVPTLNRVLGAAMITTGCKSIFSNAAGALITISDQAIDPVNELTDQENEIFKRSVVENFSITDINRLIDKFQQELTKSNENKQELTTYPRNQEKLENILARLKYFKEYLEIEVEAELKIEAENNSNYQLFKISSKVV